MRNTQKYILGGKAFIIALILVFVVRTFWVESFLISSPQMKDALKEGDRILVNKSAYGIRLPITPLTIPFTFDNFWGWQSYSTAVELPYTRIGQKIVPLNDVVLFNHPLQIDKPLDKRSLCVGRCVAQPGDTIQGNGFNLAVNGHNYQTSPDFRCEYTLPLQWMDSLTIILQRLKISPKNLVAEKNQLRLSVNKLEAYLIEEQLPDSQLVALDASLSTKFEIRIPKKGWKIKPNERNLKIYSSLIQQEQGRKAIIKNGKLFLNGKSVEEYIFTDNYYWLLSDNPINGIDSYQLGFISEKNIIGKAIFIWFSANSDSISWNRIFLAVK